MSADGRAEAPRPLLTVVRGEPTAVELAALVTVLAARAAAAADDPPPRRTPWNAPSRMVRTPVDPGPGGWRASALPR